MKLSIKVTEFITTAESKALATHGASGLNVVPVSAIHADEDTIKLYDFFMGKTANNLKEAGEVSLVAWDGLAGVQLKCSSKYLENGDDFTRADSWSKETFPDRKLRGLIILKPIEVHEVSIAGNKVLG